MTGFWEVARLRHDILYFVIRLMPTRAAARPASNADAALRPHRCAFTRSLRRQSTAYFVKLGCRRTRDGI